MAKNLEASLTRMIVAMPSSNIGAGARWRVLETVAQQMTMHQESVFSVTSVGETSARLSYKTRYSAPAQSVNGLPLSDLRGTGDGEITINFLRPTPARMSFRSTIDMTLNGVAVHNSQTMVLVARSL